MHTPSRLPSRLGAVLQLAVLVGVWMFVGSPAVADHEAGVDVHVEDNFYVPVVIEIEAGRNVVWENYGLNPHTVTHQSEDPKFDSHPDCPDGQCMIRGEQYSRTFSAGGEFPYYCKIHGTRDTPPNPNMGPDDQPCGMCGIVRVTGGVTPSPTAPPTPQPTPAPTPPPATTEPPSRTPRPAGPVETPSPTPSPTPDEAATPTPSEPSPDAGSFAAPEEDEGTSTGRVVGIVVAVLALGTAGGLAWFSLLRGR